MGQLIKVHSNPELDETKLSSHHIEVYLFIVKDIDLSSPFFPLSHYFNFLPYDVPQDLLGFHRPPDTRKIMSTKDIGGALS